MKATVVKEAPVLLPNKESKNFCHARTAGKTETVSEGTDVEGTIRIIAGLRGSKPFDYKIFQITGMNGVKLEHPKLIYLNNIKPMNATDVQLGADSARTGTIVNLPSNSMLGIKPIGCALAGAGLGYWYAKKKGKSKTGLAVVGLIGGYIAGKFWQSQTNVTIKPSR